MANFWLEKSYRSKLQNKISQLLTTLFINIQVPDKLAEKRLNDAAAAAFVTYYNGNKSAFKRLDETINYQITLIIGKNDRIEEVCFKFKEKHEEI